MLESYILENPWLSVLIWSALYISDYYVTIYTAALYKRGANAHIIFEGSLELTPYYQRDVDGLRRFSPRFVGALIYSNMLLILVWFLAVSYLHVPEAFSFCVGVLFLREAAVHLRHFRNIAVFKHALESGNISGKISYPRWVSLDLSAVEFISFGILCLLLFFLSGIWFFLGGGVANVFTGLRHRSWSRKARREREDQ